MDGVVVSDEDDTELMVHINPGALWKESDHIPSQPEYRTLVTAGILSLR